MPEPLDCAAPRGLDTAMGNLCRLRQWLLLGLLAAVSACQSVTMISPPPAPAALAVSGSPTQGLLLHFPGVSGECRVDHELVQGLRAGNVPADIQIYDWTCNDPGIPALRAYARNQEQAQKIADRLIQEFHADPSRKFYLTSHSGGAGVAIWTLEKLPPDVKVETVLLLAPALSSQYDLSKGLRHVRGKIYVFYSSMDTLVLSIGTRTFGTIDGLYTDAAGVSGFVKPASGDAAQYAKLVQKAYDPLWVRYGNIGDHLGPTATPFAKAVLAPLLDGAE